MSNDEYVRVKKSDIEAIASAIKTALGITSTFKISDMPELISSIAGTTNVPSRLNLLSHIESFNKDESKLFINDENGNAGFVYASQLRGNQVKTVQSIPNNAEQGDYYFKEV